MAQNGGFSTVKRAELLEIQLPSPVDPCVGPRVPTAAESGAYRWSRRPGSGLIVPASRRLMRVDVGWKH